MKIGMIYDAAYPWLKGGGEKALYELAVHLRDKGHEVHLFTMQLWEGPADMVRDGLHYHGICRAMPLYTAGGRRSILQALRFGAGVLFCLPRYHVARFDVFDVHVFPYFSVLAFWIVRTLTGSRVTWVATWLEVWGIEYWAKYLGWRGRLGWCMERLCARVAPSHLCISGTTARRLVEMLKVRAEVVSCVPRGFDPPPVVGPGEKRRWGCVFVGRLVEHKRVDLLIRAWPDVLRRVPGATLDIVGAGPETASLERAVEAAGLGESIRFHGAMGDAALVRRCLAQGELLLLPSVREGQGLVVLEALAMGTAVLVAAGEESAADEILAAAGVAPYCTLPFSASAGEWADRIVLLLSNRQVLEGVPVVCGPWVHRLGWREWIAPRVEAVYLGATGARAPGGRSGQHQTRSGEAA